MSEKTPYYQRVKEIRKEKKLSLAAVKELVGLSTSTLSEFETGKTSVSTDNLIALCDALGANIGWVMTGRGPKYESEAKHISGIPEQTTMLLKEENKLQEYTRSAIIPAESALQQGIPASAIPLYDIDINAGNVQRLIDDKNDVPMVGWLQLEEMSSTVGLLGVRAKGNSMAAYINNGDLMLIRRIEDWSFLNYGLPYVVVGQETTAVKYLRKGPDNNTWTLKSHNKDYDEFDVPKSVVRHLFAVVKVLKDIAY